MRAECCFAQTPHGKSDRVCFKELVMLERRSKEETYCYSALSDMPCRAWREMMVE